MTEKIKKIRFETDPYNRLIIDNSPGGKKVLPRFRQVLDGFFKTDENNNLTYHIKAPLSAEDQTPYQIRLKGQWSLTDNYDLRFAMEKEARQTLGDQITLKGEILDVNENSLLFAISTTSKENMQSTYVLRLEGLWKADKNNRLSFFIKKESGKYDILTFNGAWEINKNHQIVYSYEKAGLLRRTRITHMLTFKGCWDIKDRLRLSYVLAGSSDSVFNFAANAGVFKDNYIKYELGIGSKIKVKQKVQTVILSGKWKLKKNIGLIFEMEYENNIIDSILFGAEAKLTSKDTVIFKLKNEKNNKNLGATLELSHEMLEGDGEAFLRILRSRQEAAIYAGAAWRW